MRLLYLFFKFDINTSNCKELINTLDYLNKISIEEKKSGEH